MKESLISEIEEKDNIKHSLNLIIKYNFRISLIMAVFLFLLISPLSVTLQNSLVYGNSALRSNIVITNYNEENSYGINVITNGFWFKQQYSFLVSTNNIPHTELDEIFLLQNENKKRFDSSILVYSENITEPGPGTNDVEFFDELKTITFVTLHWDIETPTLVFYSYNISSKGSSIFNVNWYSSLTKHELKTCRQNNTEMSLITQPRLILSSQISSSVVDNRLKFISNLNNGHLTTPNSIYVPAIPNRLKFISDKHNIGLLLLYDKLNESAIILQMVEISPINGELKRTNVIVQGSTYKLPFALSAYNPSTQTYYATVALEKSHSTYIMLLSYNRKTGNYSLVTLKNIGSYPASSVINSATYESTAVITSQLVINPLTNDLYLIARLYSSETTQYELFVFKYDQDSQSFIEESHSDESYVCAATSESSLFTRIFDSYIDERGVLHIIYLTLKPNSLYTGLNLAKYTLGVPSSWDINTILLPSDKSERIIYNWRSVRFIYNLTSRQYLGQYVLHGVAKGLPYYPNHHNKFYHILAVVNSTTLSSVKPYLLDVIPTLTFWAYVVCGSILFAVIVLSVIYLYKRIRLRSRGSSSKSKTSIIKRRL